MNEHQKFEAEVAQNTQNLADDADLRSLSLRWVEHASRHRYVYNFAFMGRPIIQFPQDMVAVQELIWKVNPISCHTISRLNRTKRNTILIGTLIAHNTYRLNWKKHYTSLPYIVVKTRLFQSIDKDCISLLKDIYFLWSNLSKNTDTKTWTWEWVTT